MQDMRKKLPNYQKIINISWKSQKMSKRNDWKKNKMRDKFWRPRKKNYKKIIRKL